MAKQGEQPAAACGRARFAPQLRREAMALYRQVLLGGLGRDKLKAAMEAQFELTPEDAAALEEQLAEELQQHGARLLTPGCLQHELAVAVARRERIFHLAMQAEDLRTALAAETDRGRLLGLYDLDAHTLSTSDDELQDAVQALRELLDCEMPEGGARDQPPAAAENGLHAASSKPGPAEPSLQRTNTTSPQNVQENVLRRKSPVAAPRRSPPEPC